MNLLGSSGLKIFLDAGLPVDPNLIESLSREVLEEKIASIIYQQVRSDELTKAEQKSQLKPSQPPQPSPRRSLEYLEAQKEQYNLVIEIKTPVASPAQSPPSSPEPKQSLFVPPQSKQQDVPPTQQPQSNTQFIVLSKSEDDSYIFEVTIEDEKLEGNFFFAKIKVFTSKKFYPIQR